jgi:hypothetical protein
MHRNEDIIHERRPNFNVYFRQNAKLCNLCGGRLFFCARLTKCGHQFLQNVQEKSAKNGVPGHPPFRPALVFGIMHRKHRPRFKGICRDSGGVARVNYRLAAQAA